MLPPSDISQAYSNRQGALWPPEPPQPLLPLNQGPERYGQYPSDPHRDPRSMYYYPGWESSAV